MLNIALISVNPTETNTPAGMYTTALASLLGERGHSVSIFCPTSASPRPANSYAGATTIHRLNARRGSMPNAFVIHACQLVFECHRSKPFDVIQCIDSPSCIPALLAMRSMGMIAAKIVSCVVDPQEHARPLPAKQSHMADMTISVVPQRHSNADDQQSFEIPFPLSPALWNPPTDHDGPLLLAYDSASDAKRALMIESFKHSGASGLGWSLAMLNADGRWTVLSGTKPTPSTQSHRHIIIASGQAAPIIPFFAYLLGSPSIVSDLTPIWPEQRAAREPCLYRDSDSASLAQTIQRTIQQPRSTHDSCIDAMTKSITSRHLSAHIIDLYEHAWAMPTPIHQTANQLSLWKQLETPSIPHSTHAMCTGAL